MEPDLCALCKGACCEDVAVGLEGLPPDKLEFLRIRGTAREVTTPDGRVVTALLIPHRCQHLTSDGRCGIYETRPQICRDLAMGGGACRSIIRRRRPGWRLIP